MKPILIYCCVLLAGCSLLEPIDVVEAPELDMAFDAGGDSGEAIDDAGPDLVEQLDAASDASSDAGLDAGDGGDDAGLPLRLPTAVVAYDFDSVEGTIVEDRTEGTPYDLQASGNVEFRSDATAVIGVDGVLQTITPPEELTTAIAATGEFAVAVWVATSDLDQGESGVTGTEVRIVSYSIDQANRNFMFAQWASSAALRVRTTGSSANGTPQNAVFNVFTDTDLHFYLFQIRGDSLELYRDGVLLGLEPTNGLIDGWDSSYPILIGNEANGNRGWMGQIHSLAIYDRGFSSEEVSEAFSAGPDGLVPASL